MLKSPFLCTLPFNFVSKPAADCKPCCYYKLNKNEQKDTQLKSSVETAFSSSTFKNIRKKMLNEEYLEGCIRCYDEEEAGLKSYGREMSEHLNKLQKQNSPPHTQKYNQPDTIIKGVQIALSRECNLACRMCSSEFSTKWDLISRKLNRQIPQKRNIKFENVISKAETYHSADIWKILGGEPFIGKSFYNFLENIKNKDLSKKIFVINTNCTVFPNSKYLDILLKAKKTILHISIDGTENLGEYIRVYSKWRQVDKVASLWSELAEKHPSLSVYTRTTISIYNIHNIYSIFQWAKNKNIPFQFHMLYGPTYLRCWTLPENIRKHIYDYYLEFPDFHEYLSKLKKFLLRKQEGSIKGFLDFNDKMDKICGQDFFNVNSFYTRKDLEKAIC
ncbi:MAG: twitch domain-containing radical SAM protein [Bdellovibrionales bacterium]|nr:twitch domain-containing radical SAM protein [Bdellovibrionales bacterium]